MSKPVKVAWGIWVGSVRTKSSADSISNRAEVLGLDAVAILPSGLPLLNENGVAAAGLARPIDRITTPSTHRSVVCMACGLHFPWNA